MKNLFEIKGTIIDPRKVAAFSWGWASLSDPQKRAEAYGDLAVWFVGGAFAGGVAAPHLVVPEVTGVDYDAFVEAVDASVK